MCISDIEHQVRKAWNAGLTRAELINTVCSRNPHVSPEVVGNSYDNLEDKVGCRSLTPQEVWGGVPLNHKEEEKPTGNDFYDRWKGLTGTGAFLKEQCKILKERQL